MDSKRETGLIDPSIIKRTWAVFPEEQKLLFSSTNLMRRLTTISKDEIKEFNKRHNLAAIMNLFARNCELIHFSIVCLMNGGYAPTKIMLRTALENSLCMRLFNERRNLAKEWFSDPNKFREQWSPRRIRDELFEKESNLWKTYNKFYWQLCDYSHPSFRGWREQISKKGIHWRPAFDPDYSSECIGLVFFVIVHSFMPFVDHRAFHKWLPNKLIEEINKLLPLDSQMVRRHFQIK